MLKNKILLSTLVLLICNFEISASSPGEFNIGASFGYGLHSTPFFEGQINFYYSIFENLSTGVGIGISPMLLNIGANLFTEYSIGSFFINGTIGLNKPISKQQFYSTYYIGLYPGFGFKFVPDNKKILIPNKIWINYGYLVLERGDIGYIENIKSMTNNWNFRIGFGW